MRMSWREGGSCPPSLPHLPTALGDWVGWADAGGGPGWILRGGTPGEEDDVFCDRLKRDSTSPTFHHDNFCCFIFSLQIWGSGSSKRACGGG